MGYVCRLRRYGCPGAFKLDRTLARAQELLGSDAPLAVASTLADLGEAARSIRDLADFLDRHPNAILIGRPKP